MADRTVSQPESGQQTTVTDILETRGQWSTQIPRTVEYADTHIHLIAQCHIAFLLFALLA